MTLVPFGIIYDTRT